MVENATKSQTAESAIFHNYRPGTGVSDLDSSARPKVTAANYESWVTYYSGVLNKV